MYIYTYIYICVCVCVCMYVCVCVIFVQLSVTDVDKIVLFSLSLKWWYSKRDIYQPLSLGGLSFSSSWGC